MKTFYKAKDATFWELLSDILGQYVDMSIDARSRQSQQEKEALLWKNSFRRRKYGCPREGCNLGLLTL